MIVTTVPTTPELCSHHTSYGSLKSTRFSRKYLPTCIGAGRSPCSFRLGLVVPTLWRSDLHNTELSCTRQSMLSGVVLQRQEKKRRNQENCLQWNQTVWLP